MFVPVPLKVIPVRALPLGSLNLRIYDRGLAQISAGLLPTDVEGKWMGAVISSDPFALTCTG